MVLKQSFDHYRAYFGREGGATATEYIILLVFIGLAIFAAVQLVGGNLDSAYRSAANAVPGAGNGADAS